MYIFRGIKPLDSIPWVIKCPHVSHHPTMIGIWSFLWPTILGDVLYIPKSWDINPNPMKNSMKNPIKPPFSYGFPMVFLWFSYGFPIDHSIKIVPKTSRRPQNPKRSTSLQALGQLKPQDLRRCFRGKRRAFFKGD